MTNNLIAFDHTAEQNNHIQQLVNEIQKLRQDNATLTAITLRLRATDLTPADIAQSLIAGCPQWRAVALALVFHAMEQEGE